MTDLNTPVPKPLPHVQGRRLFASTPEQRAQADAKDQNLTQYRRSYWQDYKKKIRRVFGTISVDEFQYWSSLAKQQERTVWSQIYSCACAYMRGTPLMHRDVLTAQRDLQSQIRQIGNNLNQAVRLGHIKARRDGQLTASPDDEVGQAVLAAMTRLEQRVLQFESNVRALQTVASSGSSSAQSDDH